MSVQSNYYYTVDLNEGATLVKLHKPIYHQNARADVFRVTVTTDGTAEDLTDASCKAWFVRADGVTVPIDGSISNSKITVTLPANCYAMTGLFRLSIDLIKDSITHTVLHVDGAVLLTRTDKLTSGGSGTQSFDELLAAVAAAKRSETWPNLLHNSNMANPINQRGASTYTGSGKYTIDRWFLTGNNTKCTVRTSDVRVETTVGSAYATLAQKVANIKQYAGKTLTLAARVYSNVIPQMYARDVSSDTAVTLGTRARGTAAASNTLVTTFTVPDDAAEGNIEVLIQSVSTAVGDYITIYWAALYEGEFTAESLPPWQPKDYSAELLECQRFFVCINAATSHPVGFGETYGTTGARIQIPTPVQMRTNPTISIEYDSTAGEPRITANGSQFTVTAFNNVLARANGVHMAVSAASVVSNHACILFINQPGKVLLSADL